jgi:hypothetical protein
MELDLLPLRAAPIRKDGKAVFSFDDTLTHSDLDPCPFFADENPTTSIISCCSFHSESVIEGLTALNEVKVARLMYDDMIPKQAVAFSGVLRETADHWEKVQHEEWERWFGTSSGDGQAAGKEWIMLADAGATLEDVLRSIRKAATWYEKVGNLGCFVFASY